MEKSKITYDKVFKLSVLGAIALTILVYLTSFLLAGFRETLLPDKGAAWYYWKLPEFDLVATLVVWVCYVLHQLTVWVLLYKMKIKSENKTITLKDNVVLLAVNAGFVVLHIIQSVFFYEGLAGTTPVFLSQVSVIIMLVFILILLNSRRGLFFGKKVLLPKDGVLAVKNLHGIYIAWALTFTFWFHPTEGNIGHLLGFFYMFLLFIQLSMAYTPLHFNVKWITLLEVFVTFHGTAIAILYTKSMWQMFFFGFAMMFVVTGIYGIAKSWKIPMILSAIYVVFAIIVYLGTFNENLSLAMIHQVTWIPVILYGLTFAFAIILWPLGVIMRKVISKHGAK